MASEKSISVRDSLNKMIDELAKDTDDKESNVLACCIALAVEEVEKWMYQGAYTPSVVPYREGKEFSMPVPSVPVSKSESEDDFTGPPWARIRKDSIKDMPAFNRVKTKAALKPVMVRTPLKLDKIEPGDWDKDTMRAFMAGNELSFVACIQRLLPNVLISVRESLVYKIRMVKKYPDLWGANGKGKASITQG